MRPSVVARIDPVYGAPSRPRHPVPKRHVTLVPVNSADEPPRYRVEKGLAPEAGDFLPLELVDGSDPSKRWPHRAKLPPVEPPLPLPAPRPFFTKSWEPPAQFRTFTQEHNLETSDPTLSPWWFTPSSARTPAKPARIAPLAPPTGSQSARVPSHAYDYRAWDARLVLAAQPYGPMFGEEMTRIANRLARAEANRARPPTSVGAILNPTLGVKAA